LPTYNEGSRESMRKTPGMGRRIRKRRGPRRAIGADGELAGRRSGQQAVHLGTARVDVQLAVDVERRHRPEAAARLLDGLAVLGVFLDVDLFVGDTLAVEVALGVLAEGTPGRGEHLHGMRRPGQGITSRSAVSGAPCWRLARVLTR